MEKKINVVISTHVYTTGPAQDLKEYLISKKIDRLFFIGHPLFFDVKLDGSGYEKYENGKSIEKKYVKIKKIPELFAYIDHILKSVSWVRGTRLKWDLYIGSDNLNALAGIILRRLGRVKKVIYYVIDYNPKRFENTFMNWIYHKVDQYCVEHCDETWNLSDRMKIARKKFFGFEKGNQIEVPIGIWFKRYKIEKKSPIPTLAFMGHVLKKQGVQYIIKAIPEISKKVKNFKFLVIGGGNYLETLKKLSSDVGVEKLVEFTGFVESHKDVERMLSKASAAAVIYEKFDDKGDLSFTYFADPGKLKSYMASGLPILLTDVPHNAKDIERKKCGKIVNTDPKNIAKAVIELMSDKNKLKEYQTNTRDYARDFDWEKIFFENLGRVFEDIDNKKLQNSRSVNKINMNLQKYGQYKKDIFEKLNFDFKERKKILDIGCGDGSDAEIFIKEFKLNTFGIDIYKHKKIKELTGLKYKKAGIYKIPFEDETFDYVFLHDILHHIDEKQQLYSNHIKGLRELKRVCKKNGYIIIVEGNRFNPLFYPRMVLLEKHNHFRQSYFRRIISKVFARAQFSSFEAHLYPEVFLGIFKFYERIMENMLVMKPFRAYNVAIIKRRK